MPHELTDEDKQQLIALFTEMINKPDARLIGICPPVEIASKDGWKRHRKGDTHFFVCAVGKATQKEIEVCQILDRGIPRGQF